MSCVLFLIALFRKYWNMYARKWKNNYKAIVIIMKGAVKNGSFFTAPFRVIKYEKFCLVCYSGIWASQKPMHSLPFSIFAVLRALKYSLSLFSYFTRWLA